MGSLVGWGDGSVEASRITNIMAPMRLYSLQYLQMYVNTIWVLVLSL